MLDIHCHLLPGIDDGACTMEQALELARFASDDGITRMVLIPHIQPGSENMIRWLHSQDIGCVIAHPERNKELMRNIDKLLPYMHMGCELQVTAASVAGKFGVAAQHVASQLLERGWVKILATDAHNIHHRPPALAQGRAAAASLIDSSQADKLVGDGPWMVAGGMFASV